MCDSTAGPATATIVPDRNPDVAPRLRIRPIASIRTRCHPQPDKDRRSRRDRDHVQNTHQPDRNHSSSLPPAGASESIAGLSQRPCDGSLYSGQVRK